MKRLIGVGALVALGGVACTTGVGSDGGPLSDGQADGQASDALPSDGGVLDSATPDSGTVTPGLREPCLNGTCWHTRVVALHCARFPVAENFFTGNFNVHDWTTTIWGGEETQIELVHTGGTFQPAMILVDEDGRVLFDGVVGLVQPGLTVTPELSGMTGDRVRLVIASDETVSVHLYVTGWSVVDSDFVDFLPMNVTYELVIEGLCPGGPTVPCVVNGYTVNEPACSWLHYLGREVVPSLAGSRVERIDDAAVVGWWSLKEGVLFLDNPLVYSNCNFPTTGDAHIGPLEVCVPGQAWQVGVSGVQVAVGTITGLEAAATMMYPGMSVDEILDTTARAAGLIGTDVDAVVSSTGELRHSWLHRNSAVGVTFQVGPVTSECIVGSLSWCYGTGWPSSAMFAPDKPGALSSIDDIRALLDQIAP